MSAKPTCIPVVLAAAFLVAPPAIEAVESKSSSVIISPDGLTLAVVNNDSRSVSFIDLPGLQKRAEVFVGRAPQSAAFSTDGLSLYVSNRLDDSVTVIDVSAETSTAEIPVCDEPAGMVADASGRLFVACSGSSQLAVITSDSNEVAAMVNVEGHPTGLAISPVASELYISHFSTGRISVLNMDTLSVEAVIPTGADSNLSPSISVSADGLQAWIPQTRSNATNPALLFDTTVFPIVSSIDLENRVHQPSERIFLDISDEPVNMPFDAIEIDDRLWVLNSGSNDLSVIRLDDDKGVAHIELGHNPRAMAHDPGRGQIYVNNTLSGTVSVVDTTAMEVISELAVTTLPLSPSLMNGKRLFHSTDRTDLARDQWISCATCHFGGEMDGRTWFFPDGPRNTTSLLGIADTLPMHWSGDLDELQDVEATIRDIQAGTGLAEGPDNCSPACDQAPPNAGRSKDLDDLAAFMASLKLSPNPNLEADGSLNEAAQRGKTLFESAETQCSACHVAPLYRDGLTHDVGTGNGPDEKKGASFDTPSLRGVYKTAPYLHDGSAVTLMDVLTTSNPGDQHGSTSQLTEPQRQDMVAFMRSLGGRTFAINAGLNDAWVNANAPLQGLFITVYPQTGILFLAWFTFDSVVSNGAAATFGARDQRWVTAAGPFSGDSATLQAELTSGGIFNASNPTATQTTGYGTIEVEFTDCRSGIVRYDFPSLGLKGEFVITRVLENNVALCDAMTP